MKSVNALGSHGATQTNDGSTDLAAAKHLLSDFRNRLQMLDCDLSNLYAALDGPPGAVATLAEEVSDRDWFVDGTDIRDLLPGGCLPGQPADVAKHVAASSTASS
jgi:hypothetical protein